MLKMYGALAILFIITKVAHADSSIGKPCADVDGWFCVPSEICDINNHTTEDIEFFPDESEVACRTDEVCCSKKPNIGFGQNDTAKNLCGVVKRHRYVIPGDNSLHPKHVTWTVAFMLPVSHKNDEHRLRFLANGVLIHQRAVLTTAWNVEEKINKWAGRRTVYAVVGDYDERKTETKRKALRVEEIVKHQKYERPGTSTGQRNIAVAFLKNSVSDYHSEVVPACLPPRKHQFASGGGGCFFTGWGQDGKELHQSVLGFLQVPMVNDADCSERGRRNNSYGSYFTVPWSLRCAGGERNTDLCEGGDGGSPLVCLIEGSADRYMLAGMVAAVQSCGNHEIPGLFTDVVALRSWVDMQMRIHQLALPDGDVITG